jgi:zeaxanthin glucosyltransferase
MAKIIFIVDAEEGHIIPSFGLAHSLKERGHTIFYLSIIDSEDLVREQGFDFFPIFEDIYYKGYRDQYKKLSLPPGIKASTDWELQKAYDKHIKALMNGALDPLLDKLQADLFIINTFLHTDTLILHYKYKVDPVILTPFLRESGRTMASDCFDYLTNIGITEIVPFIDFLEAQDEGIVSMTQLSEPFNTFCELVVCPRELDFDQHPLNPNVHHIGPSIRKSAGGRDIHALYDIPGDKKIIYGSMGSQPVRHGDVCNVFFGNMINVMRLDEFQDCHLILSIGPEFDKDRLGELPANVTVAKWTPQLDILKVAAAAVIHGGLGSVKECIYYGVPMIVFPLGYDQPLNARRVAQHRLGIAGDITTVSEKDIQCYFYEVLTNEEIRKNIQAMQTVFREKEDAQIGAEIIEQLLAARENQKYKEYLTI